MLTHPTLDLLENLGLHGMAKGFHDLAKNPEAASLGHAEWLGRQVRWCGFMASGSSHPSSGVKRVIQPRAAGGKRIAKVRWLLLIA